MTLEVPYFKQQTFYTCAPASLQMLLRFFGMTTPSEEELAQRLKTDNIYGTHHQNIIDEIIKHGLHCIAKKNSSLDEVLHYIDHRKLPVLVNYVEPVGDEGHYALVIGHEKDTLILNDPWHGPNFKLSKDDFIDRWHDELREFPQWMLVASKEALEIDGQH